MKHEPIIFLEDTALKAAVTLKNERLELFQTRKLMRTAFYADLGRKPPTRISHMASYVRAVKMKWNLQYNNSARQLLAEIEGFPNWEALQNAE